MAKSNARSSSSSDRRPNPTRKHPPSTSSKAPPVEALTTEGMKLGVDVEKEAWRYLCRWYKSGLDKTVKEIIRAQSSGSSHQLVQRYIRFLLARGGGASFTPPRDVWLVWQSHMLRPGKYAYHCLKLTGKVISHAFEHDLPGGGEGDDDDANRKLDNAECRSIAEGLQKVITDELMGILATEALAKDWAFFDDLLTNFDKCGITNIRGHVTSDVAKDCPDIGWLMEGLHELYLKYLQLTHKYGSDVTPTLEIDWLWHTHLLHPTSYADDCQKMFKTNIGHRPFTADDAGSIPAKHALSTSLWTKHCGNSPAELITQLIRKHNKRETAVPKRDEVAQLDAMGFHDRGTSLQALEATDFDVNGAANLLIEWQKEGRTPPTRRGKAKGALRGTSTGSGHKGAGGSVKAPPIGEVGVTRSEYERRRDYVDWVAAHSSPVLEMTTFLKCQKSAARMLNEGSGEPVQGLMSLPVDVMYRTLRRDEWQVGGTIAYCGCECPECRQLLVREEIPGGLALACGCEGSVCQCGRKVDRQRREMPGPDHRGKLMWWCGTCGCAKCGKLPSTCKCDEDRCCRCCSCFLPKAVVRTQDGLRIPFSSLKEGEFIATGQSPSSPPISGSFGCQAAYRRVTKVWKCPVPGGRVDSYWRGPSGGGVTTGHPVWDQEQWRRPEELVADGLWRVETQPVDFVYTIELEGHEDTVEVGGVVCAALGAYCGPSFGWNIFTRKTQRCDKSDCLLCDQVVLLKQASVDFAHIGEDALAVRYPPVVMKVGRRQCSWMAK
ncbi:unnamed protein product [Vitrella brassicaformis CCMP3155]|uniref:UBA domain-containing protein n=3 Tax=Vitrella brassicaformis TaxID=1169539 RepID=A0A0G4GXC1_VITBC|nr:unnamed protein product [Vitrella brassicaformis CCMP3155]|eukprot:CEM35630.1 unnamed protein product [Vitrella brassicaformis CCMP3155]